MKTTTAVGNDNYAFHYGGRRNDKDRDAESHTQDPFEI